MKIKILYFSGNMLEWSHARIERHVRAVLGPDNPINTDFLFKRGRTDGFAVTLCYDASNVPRPKGRGFEVDENG